MKSTRFEDGRTCCERGRDMAGRGRRADHRIGLACWHVIGLFAVCGLLPVRGVAPSELDMTYIASNQLVTVSLTGGTGRWHRLEASTNLLDWAPVTNLYQTDSPATWVDTGATNRARRFFRSMQLTALDNYVAAPDTNYSYTLLNSYPASGYTTYVLEMTSQAYLTAADVNRTLWKHWLIIVRPSGATNSHALLYIGSGSNGGSAPTSPNSNLRQIATNNGTVVAELRMVPNQPLRFTGEPFDRTEDDFIAYTWDKYLRTGEERWPARLPMTKAAVRALDTVTAFCASSAGGGLAVNKFVVTGASKRGWTTWTTAAVDKRVVAIIPMVIDVLNVEVSMLHHYAAYGFWAPAIQDYEEMGIMNWIDTPEFDALMEIEDPYTYRERLTLPKFIINSTGDEFFLPDSSQFYFDDLRGVKYLRYMPNTGHGLSSDAYVTIEGCYQSVLFGAPLPRFSWNLVSSNSLRVLAADLPNEVRLWQAMNPDARDFRLGTVTWQSSLLAHLGFGVFMGNVSTPGQGWRAFLIELTYLRSGLATLKFTTPVYVVPDTLPYGHPPAPP